MSNKVKNVSSFADLTAKMDKDHDGQISFKEFKSNISIFNKFLHKNGSGRVDKDGAKSIFKYLSKNDESISENDLKDMDKLYKDHKMNKFIKDAEKAKAERHKEKSKKPKFNEVG